MTVRRAIHTLWFIARPSEDVPGDWEAHCLEFDVFGQGQTLTEALELCIGSAVIHVRETLRAGRDPYDSSAPQEFWQLLDSILDAGEKLTAAQFTAIATADEDRSAIGGVFALQYRVAVDIDFHIVDGEPIPQQSPLVWKKAA